MMFEAIVFGLLGLIVGSFLNVVILRHGARTLGGRSGCMSCGSQLRWYEMLPVLSWIALRGRCRTCRVWISAQYPLVEVITAASFVFIGIAPIELYLKALCLIVSALLVIIAVYDIRHTIIPDEWAYAFAFIAFIISMIGYANSPDGNLVLALFAGPFTAFPLFALWAASHGRWMGLGDPKLALGIGWLLGVPLGLYAVFYAFIIGAIISVCILLPFDYIRHVLGITRLGGVQSGFTMKSEVPFGPFLIASCALLWWASTYGVSLPFLI